MERGVVVRDLRDDSGQTPLHWAVRVHQNAADSTAVLIWRHALAMNAGILALIWLLLITATLRCVSS